MPHLVAALLAATDRAELTRFQRYPVSPTCIFSRHVPEPLAAGATPSMSYSSRFRAHHAADCSYRCCSRSTSIPQVSAASRLRWPPMSRSPGGRDMLKRSLIFFLAVAASFVVTSPVIWFVLDADLHLNKANATTSTAAVPSKAAASEPFKMAHAANQTTTRILALDRAKHLAFWAFVLKNKKQACDVVVRTAYQGGT